MSLRQTHIDRIRDGSFDALIVGGGINGAVTAASLAGRGANGGSLPIGPCYGHRGEARAGGRRPGQLS